TKLAAAQPDKTGQAANRNAPSKRFLKIGTADSRLHVLFVMKFGFKDHHFYDLPAENKPVAQTVQRARI
ncbi:MAG: hypothetical protein WCD69_22870, partial [Xanthobacteraceae bacterium]